jgi:hypothetical protein
MLRVDVASESGPKFLLSSENITSCYLLMALLRSFGECLSILDPQTFPAAFGCNYETCRWDATSDLP